MQFLHIMWSGSRGHKVSLSLSSSSSFFSTISHSLRSLSHVQFCCLRMHKIWRVQMAIAVKAPSKTAELIILNPWGMRVYVWEKWLWKSETVLYHRIGQQLLQHSNTMLEGRQPRLFCICYLCMIVIWITSSRSLKLSKLPQGRKTISIY